MISSAIQFGVNMDLKNLLVLINSKLHSKSCYYLY